MTEPVGAEARALLEALLVFEQATVSDITTTSPDRLARSLAGLTPGEAAAFAEYLPALLAALRAASRAADSAPALAPTLRLL